MNAARFTVLRASVAFFAILAMGALGLLVPSLGGRQPLLLLPSGIAVAVIYRWGWRLWPAVFAAGVAIEVLGRNPTPAALGVGAGLASGACFCCWLLNANQFNANFARARDVPVFILCAAVGMLPAAVLGVLSYAGEGLWLPDGGLAFLRWGGNVIAGVLLVTPILLTWSLQNLRKFFDGWPGSGLWLLTIAGCCAVILLVPSPLGRPLIVVVANLLVVAGAIQFGLLPSAIGALLICLTTAASFLFKQGAFSQYDTLQGLVTIWSFSAVLPALFLTTAALLAERDAAALETLRAERRYSEVFDGNPHPMWVHNRQTGAFLLVNEAAIARYGWSREEFLARKVDDLAAPGQRRVLPDPPEEDAADAAAIVAASEPFETHHRTRSGQLFDVEVWTRSISFAGESAMLVFVLDVTERRAFGRALIDAVAREQRRIGQEMHDGLGQELTGLALIARALATRAQKEWPARAAELEEVAALAASCIGGSRRIVQGLAPLSDADDSLEAALTGLAHRSSMSGTTVSFRGRCAAQPPLQLETRGHLYRIAQEAVQNALKHAGATAIEIELRNEASGMLRLSIVDDGYGSSPTAPRGMGLGMRTMRYRASSIGARIVIGPRPGGGYAVVCEVPHQTRERRGLA
jgi:PAS domain S-box-containing protein